MSDIEGKKLVGVGLTKIRGVGHSFSNAICKILNINKNEKMGNLKDKDLENISQILKNPLSFKESIKYSEQVGRYLQLAGKYGEIKYL